MNINNVKSSTLAKLTKDEIGALDLCNHGVMLYRGELKTRYKGTPRKVKVDDENTFCFEYGVCTIEFTQIVQTGDTKEWAVRIYDKLARGYREELYPLVGCDYIR